MARARDLRPEFFMDEGMGDLPFGARLLFAGIWCHSDLRGVFEYSSRQLRVQVFPFDEGLSSVNVQEWLTAIESKGAIARFEADGKPYGYVCKWLKHQKISKREKDIGTKRPEPPGWQEQLKKYPSGTWGVPGEDPEPTQNHTPSPAPSPSPAPAPASSPSPARSREDSPTTIPKSSSIKRNPIDKQSVRRAMEKSDPSQLAASFLVTPGYDTDWTRELGKVSLLTAFLVFAWQYDTDPIRLPSGWTNAYGEWKRRANIDGELLTLRDKYLKLYGMTA